MWYLIVLIPYFCTLSYLEVNTLLLKKGSRKNLSGISRLVLKDILGTKKEWKIKFNIDLSILNKYILNIKKNPPEWKLWFPFILFIGPPSFNLTEVYLHVLVHLMTITASHFHKNAITLLSDTDDLFSVNHNCPLFKHVHYIIHLNTSLVRIITRD